MNLMDKLRGLKDLPDDTDLLVALGIRSGDPIRITGRMVTVGNETVATAAARVALRGDPAPAESPCPPPTVDAPADGTPVIVVHDHARGVARRVRPDELVAVLHELDAGRPGPIERARKSAAVPAGPSADRAHLIEVKDL